jgi:membrane-bound lytic murein transglycosylase D
MQDDKTIIMPQGTLQEEFDSDRTLIIKDVLRVSLVDVQGNKTKEFFFSHRFIAGRSEDNDIVIQNKEVSRHHLEVKQENGDWWIYDLNSANGIYILDKLIEYKSKLNLPTSVSLGKSGIALKIQATGQRAEVRKQLANDIAVPASPIDTADKGTQGVLSKDAIKARLLAEEEAEDSGDYTRMVRKLIHEDRTIRVKKYNKVIWVLGILFLLSVTMVTYQQVALSNARILAIDMFYDIKTLEVSMSKSELMIDQSAEILEQTLKAAVNQKLAVQERIKAEQEKIAAEKERVEQEKNKLKSMKAKYQQYVKEATSFQIRFPSASSYEEELITRVAREFGESELELPDGFVDEVRRYIKYWQDSSRMQQAMERLEKNNYAPQVFFALEKEGLPLNFIYLPLQESNYDTQAIGPETPYGVAKGAWQFLATTGQEYGLPAGPLADVREYDELDARFDFHKATLAATKYLKYIYSTEAQASGLLVMASYNYGHNRVRAMIRKMPDNPRDKNFWKFIQQYEIPKETYDYVFYIFSAAVIGEDPKHFGFKFNPLLSSIN